MCFYHTSQLLWNYLLLHLKYLCYLHILYAFSLAPYMLKIRPFFADDALQEDKCTGWPLIIIHFFTAIKGCIMTWTLFDLIVVAFRFLRVIRHLRISSLTNKREHLYLDSSDILYIWCPSLFVLFPAMDNMSSFQQAVPSLENPYFFCLALYIDIWDLRIRL